MRIYPLRSVTVGLMSFLLCASLVLHCQELGQISDRKDWPLVHGNATNERYSTLTSINTDTVKRLGGAWVSTKFEDGASTRSSPVVREGVMYVTAGTRVYALNAKTGGTVWSQKFSKSVSWQGVALGEGLIFVGLQSGRVEALAEKTGKPVWGQQIGEIPPQKGESITGAPTYARGVVFVGLANGDFALRGRVVALDAKTGHELWHFFTVPSPGELGHDTWDPENSVWKVGGGGVWQTGAIDPELGLVYFVTGNAIPPFGGEERAGNNLFTCSAVALDINTGKLRWHYQLVHHDVWEADIATPLLLYDTDAGGRPQKALGVMRADGYLFLLNRETGHPILPVEERPVPQEPRMKTSATQPFPVGADEVLPDCEKWRTAKIPTGFRIGCFFTPSYFDNLNVLRPFFGMRIAPMSYSPQTRYFYATGVVFLGWRRRTEDPWMLLALGDTAPGLDSSGVLAAIDSRTDKIVWQKTMSSRGGGLLSTAGGLIFESEADGNFTAYDAKSGEIVWRFQIGMGGRGLSSGGRGPAATYEIDGEQYIAVPAGSSVWAFKLGGALQPIVKTAAILSSDNQFSGPIIDTSEIETVSLDSDGNQPVGGSRYYIDEYKFNPVRARVKTGTRVTWINNGKMVHSIEALGGSWTAGPISPAQSGYVTFNKPGRYTYICKDHPWVYGQLIVVDQTTSDGLYTADQAKRGNSYYKQSCTVCHTDTLQGADQVPSLVGETFMSHWQGRTVKDLLDRVRTTMPQMKPGSLSDKEYIDII
ncbi:MAG: PQQ-binding-like beta-propeller repeat protein, partial [Acidobacteriales bacterium]|nr:PQQ-binding-like beta-propeller repeat protein [Terriglobales bacterium]